MLRRVAETLLVALVPSVVLAQAAPEGAVPPGAATPPSASTEAGSDRPIDPGDDRVMVASTAGTLRKGMMSFTDYELVLAHFSYGITDRLQLSLGFTFPVMQVGVAPSIKWRLLETDDVRLAVLGDAGVLYFYAGWDWVLYGGGGGLMVDVCLSPDCSTFLTFGGTVQAGRANLQDTDWDGVTVIAPNFDAGAVIRLSRVVKLLLELRATMSTAPEESDTVVSTLSFLYGIRIHGANFGADVGFIRPFIAFVDDNPESLEEGMKYLPMGYPWLAFTYQW